MDIFADRTPRNAPMTKDENVSLLCHVEADVSHIPENQLQRRKGNDGQWYYELSCRIEAVCESLTSRNTTAQLLTTHRPLGIHSVHTPVQQPEI